MAHPLEVTDATFEDEVLNSDIPVLVDFWAEWCGPCKMIAPIVNDISDEYEGRMKVAKVDVDANPQAPLKYGVRGIPNAADLQGRQPRRPDRRRCPQGQAQGRRRRRPQRLATTLNKIGQGDSRSPYLPDAFRPNRGSGWAPVGPAVFKIVGPGASTGTVGSTPSHSRHFFYFYVKTPLTMQRSLLTCSTV